MTDRTPAEWAKFCAEKVMGWEDRGGRFFWDPARSHHLYMGKADEDEDPGAPEWSPWETLADAREVIEKLAKGGPYTVMRISSTQWEVILGFPSVESAPWEGCTGPHEGPAICLLTGKIIGEKHAQDK